MILIGTTLAAFAMDDPEIWGSWIRDAEHLAALAAEAGEEVRYFAALEVDARGLAPFDPLIARLDALEALAGVVTDWYAFSLDDGRTEVTTANRLRHIVTGQNIVSTFATEDHSISHLLFVAADCRPPADIVPRMLETVRPYVGPRIDTYGATCRGLPIEGGPYPLEDAMPSAACVMLERRVFTRLRWRVEAPMTDDPCYQADARDLLGIRSVVRTDVVAVHYPQSIGPIESRGHDLEVRR